MVGGGRSASIGAAAGTAAVTASGHCRRHPMCEAAMSILGGCTRRWPRRQKRPEGFCPAAPGLGLGARTVRSLAMVAEICLLLVVMLLGEAT
jgi:hypothetical protein